MSSYEQTLKLLARWLEERNIRTVEEITEAQILAYIVDLQQRGKYTCYINNAAKWANYPMRRRDYRQTVSNTTINNYMRNMKVFFTWLAESEYILQSPMRRIHALPQERKPKEYLEDDEVKLLLKNMDKSYFSEYRDMLIMMIMLDAGTRLGETLSIENGQLNITEQSIFLPADKTKGRKARTVFFSAKTAKELRRWLQYKDRYCSSDYSTVEVFAPKREPRLTYDMMEVFIGKMPNAEERFEAYRRVRHESVILKNRYKHVLDWFSREFPYYKELTVRDEKGNLVWDAVKQYQQAKLEEQIRKTGSNIVPLPAAEQSA